jgi:hypothetical protein
VIMAATPLASGRVARHTRAVLAAMVMVALPDSVGAQVHIADSAAHTDSAKPSPLFSASTPLAVTLTANIRQLRRDRDDKSPWRAATISYVDSTGQPVTIQLRAKTHGIWRLKHCDFPPVRLDFSGKNTKGTVFRHVNRPKLVNFCHDSDQFEQYVLAEFQLYRIYHLLTPVSHQVRLLRVTYRDSASGRQHAQRYAFLIEDPDQMAERLGGQLIRQKGAVPADLDAGTAAIALLFQYMVGGTDFSFYALHNTEIVSQPGGTYLPVVYDFDFTGAVDAPYATPDPQLRISSVRERRFRGFCAHRDQFPAAAQLFRERKDAIYGLYTDEIGKLLDDRTVRSTLHYFDDFYYAIATPERAQKDVFTTCLGR